MTIKWFDIWTWAGSLLYYFLYYYFIECQIVAQILMSITNYSQHTLRAKTAENCTSCVFVLVFLGSCAFTLKKIPSWVHEIDSYQSRNHCQHMQSHAHHHHPFLNLIIMVKPVYASIFVHNLRKNQFLHVRENTVNIRKTD